jgi:hypothetical protein
MRRGPQPIEIPFGDIFRTELAFVIHPNKKEKKKELCLCFSEAMYESYLKWNFSVV